MTKPEIIDICNDNEFDMDWNSERGREFRNAIIQLTSEITKDITTQGNKQRLNDFLGLYPRNLISKMQGDLKVTNFTIKDEPIYEKSIQLYKEKYDKDVLVIKNEAYDIFGGSLHDCKSLHLKPGNEFANLTEFWHLFNTVRDELEQDSIDLD